MYPVQTTKEESFDQATEKMENKQEEKLFSLFVKSKKYGLNTEGAMKIVDGKYVVLKGSRVSSAVSNTVTPGVRKKRAIAQISKDILMENVTFSSPSSAGMFVTGRTCNGWDEWKDGEGNLLSTYREELELHTKKKEV